MAIDVGEIVATLKGDTKGFEQAMDKSNASLMALGAGSVAMGNIAATAFMKVFDGAITATTAIVRWAGEASQAAERTRVLSMQLGIADHTLEAWSMAATHAGGSIDSMVGGMRTLSRHLEGLGSGAEDSVELFNKLGTGMTVVEMAGMSTEKSIRIVADRFANMEDGAEKSKLALDLFGRSGLQLLPILNQGSAGLDRAAQEARKFGVSLTDTQRAALDKYDTAVDKMSSALEGFKNSVAAAFAPSLTKNVEWMTSAVSYAKTIFTEFSNAAEKLFIRFGALAATIELIGKQIFSLNVLNKESWDLTLKQVSAIDEWAAKEIKLVDAVKNTGVEMETTAKSVKVYAASQKVLGEQIVATTQIQVKQLQELKEKAMEAMAGDFEKGDRQQEFLNDKIKDNMILYTANKEANEKLVADDLEATMMLYHAKKEFAETQAAKELEATMLLYYANKEALEKKTADEIEANMAIYREKRNLELEEELAQGRAQEAMGRFIVQKEQQRQEMMFGWSDVFGSMSQSAQFAFGQIRANFGQTVANLIQGTANWRDFWLSTQSALINSAVQWGIDIVGKFIAKNAMLLMTESATATSIAGIWSGLVGTITGLYTGMTAAVMGIFTTKNATIVAGESATATATVGIWGGAAAAVTGTFAAMTGAIQGFFIETIIPFFAAIGEAVMTFLGAIASAASATIFGIPYAVAIIAGIAIVGAAIGSLMAFAFAEGGVVTKPVMGLVGEAGPEAIIPLDRMGEFGGGGGPTTVIVELDGKQIARTVFDKMPSVMRVRGVSA